MAKNEQDTNKEISADASETPQSLEIAKKGIRTGRDFANFMSSLMSDLIEGKISPGIGNAACNAGGKLLKVVEMQMRYGQAGKGQTEKTLVLSGPEDRPEQERVQ